MASFGAIYVTLYESCKYGMSLRFWTKLVSLLAWYHDLGSESKRNVVKALQRDTRLLGKLREKKGGKASWPAQLAVFPLQTCSKLLLVVQRSTAPVIIALCLACARVCMYVCITHNHKVIVEALISERIVNDVSESNSIVCCMRESMQGKTRPTFNVRNP